VASMSDRAVSYVKPSSRWSKLFPIIRAARQALPPSPALATLALTGPLTEGLLISRSRPSLYAADGMTIGFGLLYLAWFWLTLAWMLELAGQCWRRKIDQSGLGGRCLGWLGLGLVATLAASYYTVSWGLFLRTGRFANLETGRFILFNFRHLWTYLAEAEPLQLVLTATLSTGALLGLPALLYASLTRSSIPSPSAMRVRTIAWVTLWMVMMTNWSYLDPLPSKLQRAIRLHALKHALNPSFTLYASHVENTMATPVRPTLELARLKPLSDVNLALHPTASPQTHPSIIFVAVESLRHDVIFQHHQGREILPNINRLARAGVQLTRAYAQSTHSDYSDICLVSSLYPLRSQRHHYYGPSDPWPAKRIYDLLKPVGYATAIISSQNEAWGGMSNFLASENLDLFFHPETNQAETLVDAKDADFASEIASGGLVAGKFPDAYTTDQAIAWIQEQAQAGKPFFLSMNFQSSHFPYLMPGDVPRPFSPHQVSPDSSFVSYPREQVETVRNAYFNGIHECDRQIGRLVATLESLGQLDNTILVITGENGEAFHECDLVTHAREPIEPVIHVACILHAPNHLSPRVEDYPFEHVDLVPTVLGLASLASHPNFQGIDILAPDRPPAERRLTFCHVMSSLAEADAVILAGRWKLTVDRRSGTATLNDVLHDPLQSENLFDQRPTLGGQLRSALEKWREQQLAYYHFPAYYLNYYPPQPPVWMDEPSGNSSEPESTGNGAAIGTTAPDRPARYAIIRWDHASNASLP
jgi:arylsulfatase A-like enzyme